MDKVRLSQYNYILNFSVWHPAFYLLVLCILEFGVSRYWWPTVVLRSLELSVAKHVRVTPVGVVSHSFDSEHVS